MCQAKEQYGQRQLKVLQDNTAGLAEQEKHKKAIKQKALEEVMQERDQLKQQVAAMNSVMDENAVAKQQLQQKIDQMKIAHKREMEGFVQQFNALEDAIASYHSHLLEVIGAWWTDTET